MKKTARWLIVGVIVLALIGLAVWARSQTPMVARASEAWSRGRVIGRTPVKRPVALQPAPDGGVFVIWPNMDSQLRLVHIGVDGEVSTDRILPVEANEARDPQLQVGPDGRLHVLWRDEGRPDSTIRYALLEADGTPVGESRILSGSARGNLDAPQLMRGAEEHLHALWSDEDGTYWAVLDRDGGVVAEPILLISEGRQPVIQVDEGGRPHLIWQQRTGPHTRAIYYGVIDLQEGILDTSEEITEIVLSGVSLQATALGLSTNTGYVLWSDYDRTFDRYRFYYAFFPLDAPQQKQINPWRLKIGNGPLAISPLSGPHAPLPVALSEQMVSPERGAELQIALIMVGRGEAEEQIVSASTQASLKPVMGMDDRSYLHLAWLETAGFGEYQVVYASTAPEVMENFNALTMFDAANAVLSKVFQFSMGIVTTWVVIIVWAMVPLLGLAIYHFVTSDEMLDNTRSQVALVAALAVEVALSFAMPPLVGGETAWPALRWVAPVVTAAAAAAITRGILPRQETPHLFGTFFLFTLVNSLLQMILYLLF